MSTLSLTDFAVDQENPVRQRAVAMSFIKAKSVMTDIPCKTQNTLMAKGNRFVDIVETPQWLNLGDALPKIVNTPTPWSEQKYLKGFAVPIPRVLAEAKEGGGLTKMMAKQSMPAIAAHSADIDWRFFNNNQLAAGDTQAPKCFNGLRTRLSAAWRSTYGINGECKFDLGGLDLRLGVATAQGIYTFAVVLSRALEAMDNEDGTNAVFYANEWVWSAIENSPYITTNSIFGNDTDPWGNKIVTYRNAKIRRCSRMAPTNGGTQAYVLPNTETSNGEASTGSNFSSVFGITYGDERFEIEQFKTPDMDDPRLKDDLMTYESAFYNLYGIVQTSTRSIVQIHNFRVA